MKNGQGFLDTQYVDAVYPAVYPVSGFLRGPDIRSSPSISMNIQKERQLCSRVLILRRTPWNLFENIWKFESQAH